MNYYFQIRFVEQYTNTEACFEQKNFFTSFENPCDPVISHMQLILQASRIYPISLNLRDINNYELHRKKIHLSFDTKMMIFLKYSGKFENI